MTFENILVPVDFSTHSTEAVRIAADLAQRFKGKLTLLHVFQPPTYVMPEGYLLYTPEQRDAIAKAFQEQLDGVRQQALDAGATAIETKQLEGIPSKEIAAFAEAQRCDLIVMGTHGRSGFQHLVLGSVAERVLRHATCPVLTVRAPNLEKVPPLD